MHKRFHDYIDKILMIILKVERRYRENVRIKYSTDAAC